MRLKKEQTEKLDKIGEEFNLRFILLYGSYASGKGKKGSDLDVAVMGQDRLDFQTLLEIHKQLASVFGDNKERELDLKSVHEADVLLLFEIFKEARLLYGDKTDFDEFCLYAYKNYMDSASLFRLQDILIKKKLNLYDK